MKDVFPRQKVSLLIAVFLVPSFIYWTSGLHKEGLIFLGLSLIMYHFYFGFKEKRFTVSRVLMILVGFVLMLILRNFLLLPLVSPLLAWIICYKMKLKPVLVFTTVFTVFLVLFFTVKYIIPGMDLPQSVVNKRQDFIELQGHTSVNVNDLKPTFTSFLQTAPEAFSLSILRPYPSDVRHVLSLAAAIETSAIIVFFLVFLFWRKKGMHFSPLILFCLFF